MGLLSCRQRQLLQAGTAPCAELLAAASAAGSSGSHAVGAGGHTGLLSCWRQALLQGGTAPCAEVVHVGGLGAACTLVRDV